MNIVPSTDPIRGLIARLENPKQPAPAELPARKGKNSNAGHVVFRSILSDAMTPEGLDALRDSALAQLNANSLAMGRDKLGSGDGQEWYRRQPEGRGAELEGDRYHMPKRVLFEMTYRNNVIWRKYLLPGLFTESNRTLPIAGRACRQMIARAEKTFLSVDPIISARAVNRSTGEVSPIDEAVATAGERYFQFKANEADVKGLLSRSFERAFVAGECIIKTRHKSRYNYYRTSLPVLVDGVGKVVLGANGDYIIEDQDTFVYQMLPAEDGMVAEADQSKPPVLERDGKTELRPDYTFQWKENILRKQTSYTGPSSEIVPMQDFICGPFEKDIHEAEFIGEYMSVSPFDIVQTFGGDILAGLGTEEALEETHELIRLLTDMASDGPGLKTIGEGSKTELREAGYDIPQAGHSRSEVAECYLERDADNDGSPEQIMLVVDIVRKKLIFCDYLQNVTDDYARPYTPVTIDRVDGRWHGIGMMERLEHLQQSVDLWLNRASFASSSTGTSVFFNASNVYEGDKWPAGGMALKFNSGEAWHLKPGKTAEETLAYVTVPEVKMDEFLEIMNLNMQMASNEAGILGNNDMQTAGLDSSKTATGVRDTASKGDEMFYSVTSNLNTCIKSFVEKWATILFKRMGDEEAYEWSEGDTRLTDILRKSDVRRLKYYFSLNLTGGKNEQTVQAMEMALPQVMEWAAQPWQLMAASLPMLEVQLKALMIPNAKSVLESMVNAKQQLEEAAMMQAQAEVGPPAPTL